MTEILEILAQFGGGKGGEPGNVVVRFLLPTFFWAVLAGVAYREFLRSRNSKDLWVGIASTLGMAREMLMFTAEYGAWRQVVPFDFMYNYYPPLEHAATMISGLFIGYAFLNYQLNSPNFSRPFLAFSTFTTLVLYLLTTFQWPGFLADHPGISFGRFWGDMAFRSAAAIFMGIVLGAFISSAAQGKQVSKALLCGFIFLFFDEFLMIFNIISNERHVAVYAPIRHNLHIWAIPLFLGTYLGDLSRRMAEAERMVKNIFNLSPGLLGLIRFDGTFILASPASRQIIGVPPDELKGRRLTEFGFETRQDGNLSFIPENGELFPLCFEKKYAPPHRPERWLQWHLQPAPQESILYVIVADVTEQKMVAENLLDERNKLEAILSCLGDGLTIQNADHRIVYQNQIHKKLYGDHLGEYCHRAYEKQPQVCQDCPTAMAIRDLQVHSTVRLIQHEGQAKHVEITVSPLKDGSGAVVGAIEAVRDISARKEAEREILRLNSELERRVAERTEMLVEACQELVSFSYSVSHDLRSPLRTIYGYSQLLLDDWGKKLDEQGQKYVEVIISSGRRMEQIIDAMLGFFRISQSELQYEEVNLSELATVVTAELHITHPERKVSFLIKEGMAVKGDPRLIRSVIENLFGNAWKYTAQVPDALIEFFSTDEEDITVFHIRDNGAGFSMAHADKLFIPFQRLHSEHEFSGNGVGLAIVQRIIQRHGGRVWAESAPGKGASFFFTLGCQQGSTPAEEPPRPQVDGASLDPLLSARSPLGAPSVAGIQADSAPDMPSIGAWVKQSGA